jgi:uncharacterized protein (DUF433 family)
MEFKHIVSDLGILNGKPCIKGSRISVQIILEWIASGASIRDIVTKYPHLSQEAVTEAVLYAAQFMDNDIVIETPVAA